MEITLLYMEGCPNWEEARARLVAALRDLAIPVETMRVVRVDTEEQAERLGFHGSPTILVDGRDHFLDGQETSGGLACRRFVNGDRIEGAPSPERLLAVLQASRDGM